MEEYDVVIAGAGPAGLSTAIELSKKKVKVLLLEKGKIGDCEKVWSCFEGQVKKFNLEKAVIKKISKIRIFSEFGTDVKVRAKIAMFDEKKLLLLLKSRINKKYCTIIENASFIDFERSSNRVIVKTRNKSYLSKILVDCSGTNSPIVKKLNLQKNSNYMKFCGVLIENSSIKQNEALVFDIAFDSPNNTYFWIEPIGGKKAWVGTTNYVKRQNVIKTKVLEKELGKYIKLRNLKGKKTVKRKGIVPLYDNYKTYFDNIILVGDSATQTPTDGYGLISALENSKIAAKVIKSSIKERNYSKKFLKNYEREWKKKLGVTYHFMRINQYFLSNFKTEDFDKFVVAISKFPKDKFIKSMKQDLNFSEIKILFKHIKSVFPISKMIGLIPARDYFRLTKEIFKFTFFLLRNLRTL